MANSDKNILITPNTGSATLNPLIRFTGANNTPITLRTLDTGTVSFEGTSGQLFSIADGMSGTIFSVNDISGIPSIEVLDSGTIRLAQYGGNVGIGGNAAPARLHTVLASSYTAGGSWSTNTAVFATGTSATSGAFAISYDDSAGARLTSLVPGTAWKPLTINAVSTSINYAGTLTGIVLDAAGNVGVGTASPATKFVIAGGVGEWRFNPSNITVGSNSAGYGTTFVGGVPADISTASGGAKLFLGGDGRGDGFVSTAAFFTNSTERMRITNGGVVGINTTTPNAAYKLDVNGGIQANGKFVALGGNSLQLLESSNNNSYYITNAGGALTTVYNSSERMRISGDGSATFSPGVSLTGTNAPFKIVPPSSAQGITSGITLYATFQGTGDNGARRAVDIVAGYNGGAWGSEYLTFNVGTGSGNDAGTMTTERMRIAGDGAATTSFTGTAGKALRNTYMSTSAPSGGADGDVWIKYV
jgi:hypothetical protein